MGFEIMIIIIDENYSIFKKKVMAICPHKVLTLTLKSRRTIPFHRLKLKNMLHNISDRNGISEIS